MHVFSSSSSPPQGSPQDPPDGDRLHRVRRPFRRPLRFGAGIGVSVSYAPPRSVRHDAFPELHSGRVRRLFAFSPPSLFALGDEAGAEPARPLGTRAPVIRPRRDTSEGTARVRVLDATGQARMVQKAHRGRGAEVQRDARASGVQRTKWQEEKKKCDRFWPLRRGNEVDTDLGPDIELKNFYY